MISMSIPRKLDEDAVELFRGQNVFRQDVVDVTVGQVALFLGELDQLLELLVLLFAVELGRLGNSSFLPMMIVLRHSVS